MKYASAHALAELLVRGTSSPGTPIPERLLRGIAREQQRLGSRRYAIVLLNQRFDIDGQTDEIELISGHDDQAEAEKAMDFLSATRKADLMLDPDPIGLNWEIESEGEIPFLPMPRSSVAPRSVGDRTFKARAGVYDTQYVCYRVIGPFTGPVVGRDLAEFVNCDCELRRWFETLGRESSS